MANHEELFTRRFGGGKRTYYLDVKRDTNGDRYIVISESTRKDGDKKLRNRVMVWREDFGDLFEALHDLEAFVRNGGQWEDDPSDDFLEPATQPN